MSRNLAATGLIFVLASIAWFILGGTLAARTEDSDSNQRARLSTQWGDAQVQEAPQITTRVAGAPKGEPVPIRGSNIAVAVHLEQRRKGLLWYNLYDVSFSAHYTVRNDSGNPNLRIRFALPDAAGSYENLTYAVGGRRIDNATALERGAVNFQLAPGSTTTVDIGYQARGTQSWTYKFRKGAESVSNFTLTMTTDFQAIDFPAATLLPVSEEPSGSGYRLIWRYSSLVTENGIGVTIPYPLQPGPLAQRITFWAPVALLFYFFVLLLITTLRKIELHPINYFFLACAFFAFHLLFAYLVDRIPIEWAFTICSIVSLFLTISYLRLVVGLRFAAVESGLAQFIYLVLLSLALFNEGWAGLIITCGAIVTLFITMQLTGGIRWEERFRTSAAVPQ